MRKAISHRTEGIADLIIANVSAYPSWVELEEARSYGASLTRATSSFFPKPSFPVSTKQGHYFYTSGTSSDMSGSNNDKQKPQVVVQKLGDFPYDSREYRLVVHHLPSQQHQPWIYSLDVDIEWRWEKGVKLPLHNQSLVARRDRMLAVCSFLQNDYCKSKNASLLAFLLAFTRRPCANQV